MKLILCANVRQRPGFVHHDVLDLPGIDIVCDFWQVPEHVKPESCDEIHFTHALEHFPMSKAVEVLELIYGLLKDGGRLYLEVPNFKWHAQMILENPRDRQIIEYAFGGQKDQYDFHYNGFTPEILQEDLMSAMFTIESLEPNSSIEVWARK